MIGYYRNSCVCVCMCVCAYVCVCMCVFSVVSDFGIPWTVTCQIPLSIEFSRQEYRSGLPFPTPEDLPNPEIKPVSLASPALAGNFFNTGTTWEAPGIPLVKDEMLELRLVCQINQARKLFKEEVAYQNQVNKGQHVMFWKLPGYVR